MARNVNTSPSPEEALRLLAVRRTGLMDHDHRGLFRSYITLARLVGDCPIAAVALVDDRRLSFIASNFPSSLQMGDIPRELSFCQHVLAEDGPVIIPDLSVDPRTHDNPYVTGAPQFRFYAGFPLRSPTGLVLGTIAVADTVPRTLDEARMAGMIALALECARTIDHHASVSGDPAMRLAILLHSLCDYMPGMSADAAYGFFMLCAGLPPDAEAAQALVALHLAIAEPHVPLRLSPLGEEIQAALGLDRARPRPRAAHRMTPAEVAAQLALLAS